MAMIHEVKGVSMAMTSSNVVEEVVVDWEDCGDEYILPEYTMSTPSTNSTSQRRSSLPQNTRDPRNDTRNRLDLD